MRNPPAKRAYDEAGALERVTAAALAIDAAQRVHDPDALALARGDLCAAVNAAYGESALWQVLRIRAMDAGSCLVRHWRCCRLRKRRPCTSPDCLVDRGVAVDGR